MFDVRRSTFLLFLLLAVQCAAADTVRITFLPPPLEGTLSLGIYDKAGKLVRTLHREATEKDFTVGLNGFITSWDGKDDAGQPALAGKYEARGYAVGEVDVEGVAMHGNDWVSGDDSPRIRAITSPRLTQEGLRLIATLADGSSSALTFDLSGKLEKAEPLLASRNVPPPGAAVAADDASQVDALQNRELLSGAAAAVGGEVTLRDGRGGPGQPQRWLAFGGGKAALASGEKWSTLETGGAVVDAALGPGETAWLIERAGEGTSVAQRSGAGELLRKLTIPAGEPQPAQIASDAERPRIALLEAADGSQRLRLLELEQAAESGKPGAEPVSTWKTLLSKTIVASDTFAAVAGRLGREKPFAPEEKIRIRLLPNDLIKGETTEVDAQVATDAQGSYLKASDGLPLRRITETPHLKWAVMGREGGRVITVFQSDGAVVEEFKVRKLANMMAFDAGEYEWTPAAAK